MALFRPCLYVLLYVCACTCVQAEESTAGSLQSQLSDFLANNDLPASDEMSGQIRQYYQRHDYQPLWNNDNGLLPRAYSLFNALIFADSKGLDPQDYDLERIRAAWKRQRSGDFTLEILLTRAFIQYCQQLFQGRFDPRLVDPDWHIYPDKLDVQAVLDQVSNEQVMDAIISKLEPQHLSYQQLRQQLQRYQKIAEQGGWRTIPDGPVLRTGMRHWQVSMIRERLAITHDLVSGSLADSDLYDEVLAEAVMRFQVRHGIDIDGHTGQQTRAAMSVPVGRRVRQILVNMERWRWLPRQLGQRYLLVNMAGFELYAEENGRVVLAMPVIIGKEYRSTPSFASKLTYMEINPYWTIPKKIVLEDLIPAQLRDSGYFASKHIRIFSGWEKDAQVLDVDEVPLRKLSSDYFPYRFRQDPGPDNSLGRIKFMLPNPYDIYLHDTPQRYLFDRRIRAFSSGCIRVADPIRLTAYLLNVPTQQKEEKVLGLIYRGEHRSLSLARPVPIYLIYWTSWADRAGSLNFREDIYHRDSLLLEHLDLRQNSQNSVK